MAHSSLRFGIGRFTTEAEIDYVIEKMASTVQRLRDMRCVDGFQACLALTLTFRTFLIASKSPLWEMVQEGIDISSIDWSQH